MSLSLEVHSTWHPKEEKDVNFFGEEEKKKSV